MSTTTNLGTVQRFPARPIYRIIVQRMDEHDNVVRQYTSEGLDKSAHYTHDEIGRMIANTIDYDLGKSHMLNRIEEDSE